MEATAAKSDNPEVRVNRSPIDKESAIKLARYGVPNVLIKDVMNCSDSYIARIVRPVRENQRALREYEDIETDAYLDTQAQILFTVRDLITKGDNASLGRVQQLVIALATLKDKERLVRGKSTSNISIQTYAVELGKIEDLRHELDTLRHAASHDTGKVDVK